MKRFALLLALVIVTDLVLGTLLAAGYRHTFTGERGGLTNLALTKDADVLVFGSSRAQFHVMSSVLARETGLRVYNAGLKGHGLLYAAAVFDLWRSRHPAPRAVILTIDPETLLKRSDELGATAILTPYVDESPVARAIVELADPWRRVLLLSRAYRFNGRVFSIAKNIRGHADPAFDGFVPAVGQMDPRDPAYGGERHGLIDVALDVPAGEIPSDELALKVAQTTFWPPKIALLTALFDRDEAAGTHIVLVHPPIIGLSQQAHDVWATRLRALIERRTNVTFVDLCAWGHPDAYAKEPRFFRDFNHLNEQGAALFSEQLARELIPLVRPSGQPQEMLRQQGS